MSLEIILRCITSIGKKGVSEQNFKGVFNCHIYDTCTGAMYMKKTH